MPIPIQVKVLGHRDVARELGRLSRYIPEEVRRTISRDVTWKAYRLLRRLTPVRWTKKTRNAWRVESYRGGYRVVNPTPAMRFIDQGTRAHGPAEKQFLYIPLNKRGSRGWNPSLTRGVDYRLAKRVKGIKAMRIAGHVRERARVWLVNELNRLLRNVVNNT